MRLVQRVLLNPELQQAAPMSPSYHPELPQAGPTPTLDEPRHAPEAELR